jgi:heme-degrading monooxygenase HmoA
MAWMLLPKSLTLVWESEKSHAKWFKESAHVIVVKSREEDNVAIKLNHMIHISMVKQDIVIEQTFF